MLRARATSPGAATTPSSATSPPRSSRCPCLHFICYLLICADAFDRVHQAGGQGAARDVGERSPCGAGKDRCSGARSVRRGQRQEARGRAGLPAACWRLARHLRRRFGAGGGARVADCAARRGLPMSRVQVIEVAGKPVAYVVPADIWAKVREMAEDAEDAAGYAEAVASDDGVRFPAAGVHARADGEHPVRAWREHRDMTQDALAAAAGVSKPFISQIEGGKREGSVGTLK